LIPIASKERASGFTAAIWRSRKVFSAIFVTSAAVAVIGMTAPDVRTNQPDLTKGGLYSLSQQMIGTPEMSPP
jgi:uncharacterized membrane protein YwaF